MELTREVLWEIRDEAEHKARVSTGHWNRVYLELADAAHIVDIMIAEQELADFACKE